MKNPDYPDSSAPVAAYSALAASAIALALVRLSCSCSSAPAAALAALSAASSAATSSPASSQTPPATTTTTIPPLAATADGIAYSSLPFDRGGFSAPDAAADGSAAISSLKVFSDGLSYRWVCGGCERMGAASRTSADCLACFWARRGVEWHGGKIDWISTSRTTRDFSNILGGYHGWSPADLDGADAFAFCIVSRDGRRRTNVIVHGP